MFLQWYQNWVRTRLRGAALPENWERYIAAAVPHFAGLSAEEKQTLAEDVLVFTAEKYWEGCGGLELTAEKVVTIAAQACLLTLHLPRDYYPNVRTILVYPSSYRAPFQVMGPGGVITEGYADRLGQASTLGSVVIAWDGVKTGTRLSHPGSNVVLHEFAHMLDFRDSATQGYPYPEGHTEFPRWHAVLAREYAALCAAAAAGEPGVLDPYGAKSVAELFAVATEAFFERPVDLRTGHPELYGILMEYYLQDPAQRLQADHSHAA